MTVPARPHWLLLPLALAGCTSEISLEELQMLPSDYAFDNTALTANSILGVPTAWTPANPIPTPDEVALGPSASYSTDFDLCTDVPPGEMDLNQAAWMAFFAANVYAHVGHFGPQAQELGFVGPAGTDVDWAACGLDLETIIADQAANEDLLEAARHHGILRDYVEERFVGNDRWGACAREWFDALDDAGAPVFDGTSLPRSSFTAWLLQNGSRQSYVELGCGGSWTFDSAEFEEGSTQVAMLRRARDPATGAPPIVIVAFRGTQPTSWNDVTVDLAFFKTDLETDERAAQGWGPGWGRVHRGFFNAYLSIDELAREIGRSLLVDEDPPQIYVTGHSLGGALATMLTSRILQDIENQLAVGGPVLDLRAVCTFGSPRVGDPTFVQHFNELAARHGVTIGRFRNDDDAVSNVPRIEFDHVGPMFHVLETAPGSVDLDVTITRYDDMETEPSSAIGSVADHDIGGYTATRDTALSSPTFNTVAYERNESGYYRRLREALEASRDPGSPLATWNHCP
ncbi:MAG: lipase family protein [Myxococcales bacterium]|nr:lipase family protein [Myxococcales bacterium]